MVAAQQGFGHRDDGQAARVCLDIGQLFRDLHDPGARRWSGVGPPAAHGAAEQQVQCQVNVARGLRLLGGRAQREHPVGVPWCPVVEDLAQPLCAGLVQFGQRVLLCGADQSVDQIDPAHTEGVLGGQ